MKFEEKKLLIILIISLVLAAITFNSYTVTSPESSLENRLFLSFMGFLGYMFLFLILIEVGRYMYRFIKK